MCVIAITKRRLKAQEFRAFWATNGGDGYGVAWPVKDGAQFSRGVLKVKDAWAHYQALGIPKGCLHVVHFRAATSGEVVPELCHPFPLGYDTALEGVVPSVLFHNGIVNEWETLAVQAAVLHPEILNGPISDTLVVAVLLERTGRRLLPLLDDYARGSGYGWANKWAIVDAKGVHKVGGFYDEHGLVVSSRAAWLPKRKGAAKVEDDVVHEEDLLDLEAEVADCEDQLLAAGLPESEIRFKLWEKFGQDLSLVRDDIA